MAYVQGNTYGNVPGMIIEAGVLYSKNPTLDGAATSTAAVTTPFNIWITGLSAGTYYYQAYVKTNAGNTYYGDVKVATYP